jgi:CHAD domain-containing protein
VEIRRILSALALLEAVIRDRRIAQLRDGLKELLKAFSRLRDIQVELALVKQAAIDAAEAKEFARFLRRKEARLVRRLRRRLRRLRLGKAGRRIGPLFRRIHGSTDAPNQSRRVKAALGHAIDRAFARVCVLRRRVEAANTATIHRLRVGFKKFRYMAESFGEMRSTAGGRWLRAMHDYQTRMGEIQDAEVLLARAEGFMRKRGTRTGALVSFQRVLLRRRDKLVKQFLASADELVEFWPPPSVTPRRSNRPGATR